MVTTRGSLDVGARLVAPACEVHVLTSATVGASFASGSALDGKRVCLRSSTALSTGGARAGAVEFDCRTVPDAHAGDFSSPELPCRTAKAIPRSGPIELEPGAYCGELAIEAGRVVVLKPGLYVGGDGQLSFGAGATVMGSGVSLFLADARSRLHAGPGSRLELSAPTAGPQAGVLIFEPAGLPRSALVLDESRGLELSGLVHLPSRNLTLGARSTGAGDRATLVLNALTLATGSEWRLLPGPKAIPVKGGGEASGGSAGEAEIVLRY